nr:MAG TPA: hypothetical protein [Caudoviricetes sp.]
MFQILLAVLELILFIVQSSFFYFTFSYLFSYMSMYKCLYI